MNFGSGGTFSGRIKAGLSVNPKTLEQSLKTDRKQEMSEEAKMAASRIPEIQMLSRFYGLIPKKFLISQKIQPSVPVQRQKSTVRPTTAKPIKSMTMNRVNSTGDTEQNGKFLQRRASVDETKTDTELPLVTRRISLERSPQKVNFKIPASAHTPERSPEVTDPVMEPLPSMPPQRIIKIDLSQLKWEEVTPEDPCHKSPPEKPKQLSRTVSAQKPNSGTGKLDSGKTEPVKQKPETENRHWTAGMTTAERRAKFGRSFSIHPSFSNMSVEEEDDDDGAESDCVPYGDSMIKTGRRSLHVEGPAEDVDTMVSSSRKGRSRSIDDAQLRQDLKTTATVVAMTPKFAVPNCTPAKSKKPELVQTKVNGPANVEIRPKILSGAATSKNDASEAVKKRISFSETRSNSLPTKIEVQKPKLPTKKSSHRQFPAASTTSPSPTRKLAIKNTANYKTFAKSGTGVVSGRPKTAPINGTSHSSNLPKPKHRHPPLKATHQMRLPPPRPATIKDEHPSKNSVQKEPEIRLVDSAVPEKQLAQESSKDETKQKTEQSEPDTVQRSVPQNTRRTMAGRSFSLDETSLLNYSTSIPDSIEAVESTLQSSKRREECLKIFEKMNKGGCSVRLNTIFRGMMPPSEYRLFMAAAEKALKENAANRETGDGGTEGAGDAGIEATTNELADSK